MNKTFTMKIPNEIYLDDFSENKTIEWEYIGPETLLIETVGAGGAISIVDERRPFLGEASPIQYIELNANDRPDVAYYLVTRSDLIVHTFEDIINDYDGSTYTRVSNPRIQDYYQLWYDASMPDPWLFNLIVRQPYSTIEMKVKNEREKIVEGLGAVALPADVEAVYTAYIAECDAWLAEKEPLMPWKFVEFPAGNVPKIPYVLLKTISELASFGAT
jgi:hypothetical protein